MPASTTATNSTTPHGLHCHFSEATLDVTEATYTIDNEAGTITLDGTSGDINAEYPSNFAATGLGVVYNDNFSFCALDFGTTYNEFKLQPAVPADPVLYEDSWFDSGEEDGYKLEGDTGGVCASATKLKYSVVLIYTLPLAPSNLEGELIANQLFSSNSR